MSELPSNWSRVPLSEISTVPEQRVPSSDERFRYIDIASIDRERKVISETQELVGANAPSRARKVVRAGDVLVSMTRPNLNAVALVPPELDGQIASTGFDVLRPKGVDPRWLYYLVRSQAFVDEMSSLVQGALYPAVRSKDVRAFLAPVAPLAEQKRIADKLDRLLAAVDTCKARLDAIPAILKRFRQSVLAAATSGELTADASEASAPWREMIFGDVLVELRNGLSPKPREEPPGTPILRISSVRPGGVDDSDIRYLEADDVDIERYKLRLGDLLFTRYNGTLEFVGVCAMYRNPSTNILLYPDKLIRARVDTQKVLPEFVELWFSAPAQRSAIEGFVRSSAGQKGIAGGDLKELPIRFPSLAEQQKIVSHVGSIFTSVAGAEAKAVASELRAGQLVQRLLARAFRGELSQM